MKHAVHVLPSTLRRYKNVHLQAGAQLSANLLYVLRMASHALLCSIASTPCQSMKSYVSVNN